VAGTLEELCTVGIVELLELTIGATLLEDAVTALLVPLLALLVPLPALLAGVLAELLETETLEFEDALRLESLDLATFEFEEMLEPESTEPESLEPDVFDVGIAWFSLSLLAIPSPML
jgi:hypothetical protein